ncbi:MAG: ABC transporter ATP-binding protein [Bacilli bacterium]|nr:ABC transporter ATP-binding protein [Bacilli bacterium]
MNNKIIEIKNLKKSFNDSHILDNISFNINKGEIICIIGTSGCGKSTLLNIISGLDDDYEGNIKYYFDKNNIGYMLQEPALFPWLSIKKNALIGANIKKLNKENDISHLLKKYKLEEHNNDYPDKISGGMKQRVALIRTISLNPELLLLDEPFAALDYQTRLNIEKDVYSIIKENNLTAIIITHDLSEAISLADKVIVLSNKPSHIKNIYDINLDDKKDPISNRKDKNFTYYYELLGKDLDLFENK